MYHRHKRKHTLHVRFAIDYKPPIPNSITAVIARDYQITKMVAKGFRSARKCIIAYPITKKKCLKPIITP